MFGFLFNSFNPSTKIVNIYYYKEFNKKQKLNTTNTKDLNLYNLIF